MHPNKPLWRARAALSPILLTAALALGLAPAACKKETAPPETTEPAAEAEAPAAEATAPAEPTAPAPETAAAPASDEVKVVLLEAGSEPRRVLRYALSPGHTEKMAMVIDMTMHMDMPQLGKQTVAMPPMKMIMDLAIAEKVGDDEARYTFEVTETDALPKDGIAPAMAQAMKTQLGQLVGMKGSAIVDTRGFNRDATIELPPGLPPQMQQMMQGTQDSMDQMSSPLPEEPVGIGAKWEQHQTLTQNGITVKQKTVFELVKLDGDKGVLKATVEQSAPEQSVQMPGMPGKAKVLSLVSKGEGQIHFNLANLVPDKASIDLDTDSAFEIDGGGQPVTMKMKAETGMTIEHP